MKKSFNKYKIYSKLNLPLKLFPTSKILKFHRSKWKQLQIKLLKSNLKKELLFKSIHKVNVKFKRWDKSKLFYKNSLVLKKSIAKSFKVNKSNYYFKRLFLNSQNKDYMFLIKNILIKTNYKADKLISQIFCLPYTNISYHFLNKYKILLNNKELKTIPFLKLGDTIKLSNFNAIIKTNILNSFYSFITIDYYTQTITIVKDLKFLTKYDFYLLDVYNYNVFNIKDYFLK